MIHPITLETYKGKYIREPGKDWAMAFVDDFLVGMYAPGFANELVRRWNVHEGLVEALEFYANFEDNADDGNYQYREPSDPEYMLTLDEGHKATIALTKAKGGL